MRRLIPHLLRSAFCAFCLGVIAYMVGQAFIDAMIDPCALSRVAGCL